jgi:hypothetical protein
MADSALRRDTFAEAGRSAAPPDDSRLLADELYANLRGFVIFQLPIEDTYGQLRRKLWLRKKDHNINFMWYDDLALT